MYQFCFYVPVDAAETVKEAIFATGAGRIGDYEACCWQSIGEGQFRPLPGANPAIGHIDSLEKIAEVKVEMVCEDALIARAVQAMIEAHPFEEPAYHVFKVQTLADL